MSNEGPATRGASQPVPSPRCPRDGEGGIRTLDRGFSPYNGLANRRLQPLGHLSEQPHFGTERVQHPQAPASGAWEACKAIRGAAFSQPGGDHRRTLHHQPPLASSGTQPDTSWAPTTTAPTRNGGARRRPARGPQRPRRRVHPLLHASARPPSPRCRPAPCSGVPRRRRPAGGAPHRSDARRTHRKARPAPGGLRCTCVGAPSRPVSRARRGPTTIVGTRVRS